MNHPTRRDDILYAGLFSSLLGLVLTVIVVGSLPVPKEAKEEAPAVATVAPGPGA